MNYIKNKYKKFIEKQYNKLFPKKEIEIPKASGVTSYNEIMKILKPHCKNIFLSDPYYLTATNEEGKRYSKESLIDARKYQLHIYDCDNYSYSIKGHWSDTLNSYCFGIAWSKEHAFNIMIDSNKQIWVIEPQTNKWFTINSIKNKKMYYPLRLIVI